MASFLGLFLCSLIFNVVGSNAAAVFKVLYSPPSLLFTATDKTLESVLKEIISASLGLSVDENIEWKGLYVLDPFSTPEAAVIVFVDGVSDLGNYTSFTAKTFQLTMDEHDSKIFESVKHRIKQQFNSTMNKVVDIRLSDQKQMRSRSLTDVFGEIKVTKISKQPLINLKYSVEEDYLFLNELETLKAITEKVLIGVIEPDNIVDLYNFRFASLHPLSDFHGPNSAELEEAKKLLNSALQDLCKAYIKAYHGSVFFATVVTDVTHSRRVGRSPDADGPDAPPAPDDKTASTGKSDEFDANFAIMFNIFFWLAFSFCFSMIAIVYVIMDMDPGRDSVIYRMTNIRMKKEA